MRSPLIIYTLAVLLTAVSFSCNKVDAVVPSGAAALSERDAAEILANALLPAYGGMLSQADQAITISKRSVGFCGVFKDSLVKASLKPANIPVSCNYKLSWKYNPSCTVSKVNVSFDGTVDYDGPRFSATLTKSATGYLSGSSLTQNSFQLALKINSEGNAVKKTVGGTPIKSKVELETTNLEFDKTTGQLIPGGEVLLSIADASGKAYAYAGKFKVTGSKKGTLILNSGTEYPITWQ